MSYTYTYDCGWWSAQPGIWERPLPPPYNDNSTIMFSVMHGFILF